MHQGGWLQSSITAFSGEKERRQTAQFPVHGGGQTREGLLVTAAPVLETSGDVAKHRAFIEHDFAYILPFLHFRGGFVRRFAPLGCTARTGLTATTEKGNRSE